MKHHLISLLLLITIPVFSQSPTTNALVMSVDQSPVTPRKYSWTTPSEKQKKNIVATKIFEGSAHDMSYLAVEASSIDPSKRKTTLQVPVDEEHLFLIKSGTMHISFRDSSWSIGPGSIALLMPGEKFTLQNEGNSRVDYYLMRYRSKSPVDKARGESSGGSFVKDWNKLRFRAHDRGGVRSYFEKGTAMSKRFEMHVTTLKPGLKSHEPHTHRAEEIILILDNPGSDRSQTEMLIGENSFHGTDGDLYYVGSNLLHGIKNVGPTACSYFAFQFE